MELHDQHRGDSLQGYAAALGDLIRMTHIDEYQAQDALKEAGLTKQQLIDAKVDEFDLNEIFPPAQEA